MKIYSLKTYFKHSIYLFKNKAKNKIHFLTLIELKIIIFNLRSREEESLWIRIALDNVDYRYE